MAQQRPLPEYDSPPLDEVALGFAFDPIVDFKIPYFGLYWQTIRTSYPQVETLPPIIRQMELAQPPSMVFPGPNDVRCLFLDQRGANLIQLQPDRFVRNWRQTDISPEPYPRYRNLKANFETEWDNFNGFLSMNGLKSPVPVQCEVTYVNNIDRGTAWNTFADLHKVITLWDDMADTLLAGPEAINISLSYSRGNPTDRLHVTLNHAIRIRDGKEVLQLSLIARAKPQGSATSDLFACMDSCHEWIVRAFTDLTTPAMHTIWRRTA